jgi:hypothetical protein
VYAIVGRDEKNHASVLAPLPLNRKLDTIGCIGVDRKKAMVIMNMKSRKVNAEINNPHQHLVLSSPCPAKALQRGERKGLSDRCIRWWRW